jgi:glutamate N-acetyltransferase/amino-acid N-acetyltransferase
VDAVSITAAAGFEAAGLACGIKASGAADLALIRATPGTVGAAVLTVNRAAAAPVELSRRHLAAGATIRAVVLNSGCANAATGLPGDRDALDTAAAVAAVVGCPIEDVLVCSTGGIGSRLPMPSLLSGIEVAHRALGATPRHGRDAATAIMTTDTVPKESTVAGSGFVVGGMAKGAGMVRPDLATMLVVVTTDAVVAPDRLDGALRIAVDGSFHELDIDGCPSTNDTVIVLASGASGVEPDLPELTDTLSRVCRELTEQLAADAEGAGRVVTLEVRGAVDDATARRAGRAVADSALVRAAFYGGDPNWGRLLAALGATDIDFDPGEFGVAYNGAAVARNGVATDLDRATLAATLREGAITVTMTIGTGPGSSRIVTTDLTPEYVIFNAEYS